ncbi:alpha/beta hydrolase [Nocardia sp. NPDC051570]|uniref:alpha/beta hydrolase n=1 Tax=Nocardia sp. NPDC051570 TaxID=3364324 RepID=UPI0037BAF63B
MRGVTVRKEQGRRPGRWAGWLRRSAAWMALATLLPFGVSVADAGTASAAFNPSGADFWVTSPTMGPIKTRVFRAADGNTGRVVYALDGMRAGQDLSGWEINTNIVDALTKANINVVMPIGGQSSFYADWNSASEFFGMAPSGGAPGGPGITQVAAGGPGKSYRYTWETFLTQDLRNALKDRLGFNPVRNGVFGLSMGGSAALTLAAYHPDQFSYAGSYSGYLNNSAPGMREALRAAMIDAGGYNIDSMAPPWGAAWLRMDPFVFAPQLKAHNTRLWVAAATGIPAAGDVHSALDVVQGVPLETLAMAGTRAFQVRMMSLGGGNTTYDFPTVGMHNWRNWESEVYRMLPDLSANIG